MHGLYKEDPLVAVEMPDWHVEEEIMRLLVLVCLQFNLDKTEVVLLMGSNLDLGNGSYTIA